MSVLLLLDFADVMQRKLNASVVGEEEDGVVEVGVEVDSFSAEVEGALQ